MDDHGGGISNETDVDSGGVEVDGGGIIVGGDHGYWLSITVLLPEVG